jgi:hypothetical protein
MITALKGGEHVTRADVLHEAEKIVNGNRLEQYGEPEDNFKKISGLWEEYLTDKNGNESVSIEPYDVAIMMILLKTGRIGHIPNLDDYIDIAGYAACAGAIRANE